jgi:ATP-binding cassette subfamily C protein
LPTGEVYRTTVQEAPPPGTRPFLAYVRTLVRRLPGRTALALALMLATGLMEGIGLLVLVPMLQLIGLDVQQGSVGQVARLVARAFAALGVPQSLLAVLAAYFLIIATNAAVQRRHAMASAVLQQRFAAGLRQDLYRAITGASWLLLIRLRASELTHALTGQVDRVSVGTHALLRLLSDGLLATVYLSLTLYVSPAITGLVLGAGALLMLLLRPAARSASRLGRETGRLGGEVYGAILEHLGGLKTARSYGAEPRNVRLFDALCAEAAATHVRTIGSQALVRRRFDVGGVLILGVTLYVAIEVLAAPTASILFLLFAFARIMPRVSGFQQHYQQCLNMLPEFEAIETLQARLLAHAEPGAAAARPLAFRETLRLEDVWFAYEGRLAQPALQGVDLVIPAGRTTAIVGPSGAGKTTLADVILALIRPDRGRLLVDGEPLVPETVAAWRAQIGYVAQETFLFHDSVRANLLWARPDATERDLRAALETAAAAGFVDRLPQGLDTVLGDRGVRLSGGERQRLALARALLRQPTLLILDEATSHLDSENERRVQDAIDRLQGHLTILVITHRLSTIRMADVIHVLEHGRIVEAGDWDALVNHDKGRFRALCQAQGLEV